MLSQRTFAGSAPYKLAYTLAFLAIPVMQGCKKPVDDTPQAIVPVEAQRPDRGEISEHILADATLSPLAQAAISSKITAPVRTFYVQRGSQVRAGQLLATLENRDLSAQALDSQGQYTAAKAAYDMQTKAQVPEEYAKAKLDEEQAKAQLHLQGEIVASRKQLFEQGAIAGREYDTAVAALAQAQAIYDSTRNHLYSLRKVSREATLKQAQGQLVSAQGRYESASAQVSYSQIRTPISGVVTDRPLFPGETAAVGIPLITVMDTSSLLAKVHLAQIVTQRLSLGDTATIMIPGLEDPIQGTVTLISPALDPGSTTVEVWVLLKNPAGIYKAGTPVHVSISGKTLHNAIKLPQDAILTSEEGEKSVLIVNGDGTAHKVNVQLGIKDSANVQITQGLIGNEMVITKGAYGLSEGTKVSVGKPDAAGDDK